MEYYPVKLKTGEVRVSHKCHPRNGPTEKYSSSFALESPGWEMTFSSLSTRANQRGSWRDGRISRRFPSQREWLLSGCCSASDFVIDRALIFWLWSCTSAHSWLYLCELSVLFLPVNFPLMSKINTTKTSCGVAEIVVKQIMLVCKLLYSNHVQIIKLYSMREWALS